MILHEFERFMFAIQRKVVASSKKIKYLKDRLGD
jgi:hypothetical protein